MPVTVGTQYASTAKGSIWCANTQPIPKSPAQRPVRPTRWETDLETETNTDDHTPEPGSSQRAKRRKFQHPEIPSDNGNSTRDLLLLSTAAAQLSPANPARHNLESGPPQTRGSGLAQEALLAQDGVRSNEAAPDSPPAPDGPASDDQPASAPIFSRIMYPSHESQTRPQSPSTADASPENQNGVTTGITVRSVCAALQLSKATYDLLSVPSPNRLPAFSISS